MAYPVALGLYAAASGVASLYAAKQNYRATRRLVHYQTRYYTGAYRENQKFWEDYVRRHHLENRVLRYPYRRGYYYNLSALYGANVRAVNSRSGLLTAGYRMMAPASLYR